MNIKKGQWVAQNGAIYTVESFNIRNQTVTYSKESAGTVETNTISVSQWKDLISAKSMVSNGQKFQMSDKSLWVVVEVSESHIHAHRDRSEQKQDFTLAQFPDLLDTKHFKLVS